jgi:hypothetical protein
MTRRIRPALLLALLALISTETAAAAPSTYSSFSIRPASGTGGFFVLTGKRGTRAAAAFRIVNTGTKAGTALLYPVDGTTGTTSGAVYLDRRARRRSVGGWIRLPLARVTLRPGEARVVRFSVLVPRRLRPGHHLGAIVAENRELTTGAGANRPRKGGGLQIRVRHLSIVAVQVNAPGSRLARMAVGGVTVGASSGYEVLYLKLRNSGNILIRPQLGVRITNRAGRVVYRRALKLDTFVPKTQIRYPLYLLRKPLPPGRYRLSGTLSYAEHVTRFSATFVISQKLVAQLPAASTPAPVTPQAASEKTSQSLLPWAVTGIALIVGLVLGALVVAKLRPPARPGN